MKLQIATITAAVMLAGPWTSAALTVTNGSLLGTSSPLATVTIRNFTTNGTVAPEISVAGSTVVSGQVPGVGSSNIADWATHNEFTITYDPTGNFVSNFVSLRLVGSGMQAYNTGPYDLSISAAPRAVPGPVNYINFQLRDSGNFPTFSGLTISSLDGTNLGDFTLGSPGTGIWSVLDPEGATLNNGFTLQGSFDLDLNRLAGQGGLTDQIFFIIGNNLNVPEPSTSALLLLPFGAQVVRRLWAGKQVS